MKIELPPPVEVASVVATTLIAVRLRHTRGRIPVAVAIRSEAVILTLTALEMPQCGAPDSKS